MKRRREPELMDDPALNSDEHLRALVSLNRINRLLGPYRNLYSEVLRLAGSDRPSILDLGSGGGGFLAYAAARREDDRGSDPTGLIGLDRSVFALQQTRRWGGRGIGCLAADARAIPLTDASIDVVTSSLFLHHFDESDAVLILREVARVARKGILICDLSRSRLSLVLTWLITRLSSRSRVFHVDGPRSVRAAYCPAEFATLAASAGLRGAEVVSRFPFRMIIVWTKAGS